tara:strand:+ start:935 stop:1759 length:825 start_codon:yes stop_codon:yes gene_type:complete
MKNVMLFADTRTGSSALFHLIRQTYQALRQPKQDGKLLDGIGEPWHSGVMRWYYRDEIYRELYDGNNYGNVPLIDQPWHILRGIHDNVYKLSYGCKHIWSHLTEGTNYSLLLKSIHEDHKIIFLDRRAIGKKCLSHMLAQQTGKWGKYTDGVPKFENIDLERLKLLCDRYKRTKRDYRSFLEEYTNNVHYITYEDMFSLDTYEEKLSRFQDVLEFLEFSRDDVIHEAAENRLNTNRIQNPIDILRTIPNFKDVCRLIRDEYDEYLIPEPLHLLP